MGEMMNETILAYIAGFWEGEGFLNEYHNNKKLSKKTGKSYSFWNLGISQKNPTVLYWIKSEFGFGTIRKKKDGVHEWRVFNKKEIRIFVRAIYPYIKFRHEKFERFIM